MKFRKYQEEIKRTDLELFDYLWSDSDYCRRLCRLSEELHYALGITTEAAEIADLVKKYVVYKKSFARDDIRNEVGDLLWYIGNLLNCYNLTFEEVMGANIEKLKKRYPDGFNEKDAKERNNG